MTKRTLTSQRPYPNSYWVEPGRLLAGEYPGGMDPADTKERLQQLLACGVTTFIDLTRELEAEPYVPLFAQLSAGPIQHLRFPILDHSIPERPHIIVDALNAIDAAHRRGECAYVHCRAGIGRTGMVVAAYLMRQGLDNEAAFDRLQTLWQECGRAKRWPVVPETDEQIEYVRRWNEPGRTQSAYKDRVEGALVGLVLADSIACAIKAKALDATLDSNAELPLADVLPADSGPTLVVLESLLTHGKHDPKDQLQRYQAWLRSVQGNPLVNVPDAFKRAVAASLWSHKKYAGSHDPRNLDAHSVARSLAVALCFPNSGERAVELAAEVSRTTQQAPVVLDVCRAFTAYVLDALLGSAATVVAAGRGPHVVALSHRLQKPEVLDVIERRASYRKRDGSAPGVLDAALQAFATASSYAAGVQALTSAAAPTATALFGALAGAAWGASAMPQPWRRSVPRQTSLVQLIEKLPTL